jgi:hypothetical protein
MTIDYPPCAWCGMLEMDTHASSNGKDICINCEEEATNEYY